MTTHDPATGATARQHLHKPDGIVAEPHCPTCLQSVTPEVYRRIAGEQRARDAQIERSVETRFAREIARLQTTKKSEIAKAIKEALTAADAKLKALAANQEGLVAARLEADRGKSAKALDEAVASTKLEHAAEKLRLETALADLQRKLAASAKTPFQLGEPGEAALYEALVGTFAEDQCRISRVAKGRAGPDLIVEVLDHAGVAIATVVVEAKNHRRWSNAFITKVRSDQRDAGASWSILATNTFPKNGRGLAVIEGVIVCDPAFVPAVMELLRRQIFTVHRQRLTAVERDEKAAALLDFIGSSACADLLDQFVKIANGLHALDQREISTHETVWKRRAELVRSLQAAHADFMGAVGAIINGPVEPMLDEEEEVPA
jgi:hypothetical protein